jgi:hypothetical protein
VTDRVRVAAALLASRMARGRLASPFTAREVYRNDWTGLTEPRVVGEALECLRELGWIRPDAGIARDGGRPTVRFHINPRVNLSLRKPWRFCRLESDTQRRTVAGGSDELVAPIPIKVYLQTSRATNH